MDRMGGRRGEGREERGGALTSRNRIKFPLCRKGKEGGGGSVTGDGFAIDEEGERRAIWQCYFGFPSLAGRSEVGSVLSQEL